MRACSEPVKLFSAFSAAPGPDQRDSNLACRFARRRWRLSPNELTDEKSILGRTPRRQVQVESCCNRTAIHHLKRHSFYELIGESNNRH